MKQKIIAVAALFALTFTAMAQSADLTIAAAEIVANDDICWVAPEWRNL